MSPFTAVLLLVLIGCAVVLIACAVMAAEADEADQERQQWHDLADERRAASALEYPVPRHPEPLVTPAPTLTEAAELLRRPFAPDLILWKPARPDDGVYGPVVEVVPYINRELVIDRLNVACPGLWSASYELAGHKKDGTGFMWCHLTIDGVTRSDLGEAKAGESFGKALLSDSLKRAAVHFGVGVSIGAMPRLECEVGDKNSFRVRRVGDGVLLTDRGRTACTKAYEDWLADVGEAAYGEVLAHAAPDQRSPIRETNAERAEMHADAPPKPVGIEIDPELTFESKLQRVIDICKARGIDVPQHDWDTTEEQVDAWLADLDANAAPQAAAA